jgi:hypothetical protein
MEILRNESPFFISDICKKYGVTPASVAHFISRNNRYLHFKTEEVRTGMGGRPAKQFAYIETLNCPHCGKQIRIDELVDLQ